MLYAQALHRKAQFSLKRYFSPEVPESAHRLESDGNFDPNIQSEGYKHHLLKMAEQNYPKHKRIIKFGPSPYIHNFDLKNGRLYQIMVAHFDSESGMFQVNDSIHCLVTAKNEVKFYSHNKVDILAQLLEKNWMTGTIESSMITAKRFSLGYFLNNPVVTAKSKKCCKWW